MASVAGLPRGDLSGRGLSPGLQQEVARVAGLLRGALPGRRLSLSLQQLARAAGLPRGARNWR